MFGRKRSPESSSPEPARKSQSRGSRMGNDASGGHRLYENTSRPTYYPSKDNYRSDRGSARDEYERRPSSSDARASRETSLCSRSPSKGNEEELEPPGTENSMLQYILTPKMPYMAWKSRLYQELEELNCLFTIEPGLKKKGNMPLEDELKYRSLAKAIISMRLDNAHLALVAHVQDPLEAMKVLNDFRDPELRHLETRAQQRLKTMVYDASVPVCDFVRSFENLVKEVEKYSGKRISDDTMKKHLLSAIVSDFPDIIDSSKSLSGEICYDGLKALLIETADRPAAAKNVASKNAGVDLRRTSDRDERGRASKTDEVNERRTPGTSATNKSGEVKESHPVSKNVEVSERRATSTNGASKNNAAANERRIADSNATGKNSKEHGSRYTGKNSHVGDPRPIGTITTAAGTNAANKNAKVYESSHTAGKNIKVDPRPVGTNTAASKSCEADEWRRPPNISAEAKDRRAAAGTNAASKNSDVYEQCAVGANSAGRNNELFERRPATKNAHNADAAEIDDQIKSDKRIQDLVEANPRLAAKEISCTKCGAYGHTVADCKRKDNRRKCYNCLKFVSDHVASTCPDRGDYLAVSKILHSQTSGKFTQESLESKFVPQSKPPPVPFVDPRYLRGKLGLPEPPEILDDDNEEDVEDEDDFLSDDLPLIGGLRQVYHIRRRFTTKKLKSGRVVRKGLIFTDSDFYTDVEYREMFVEEDETDPGDIILETIKVMTTTKQN